MTEGVVLLIYWTSHQGTRKIMIIYFLYTLYLLFIVFAVGPTPKMWSKFLPKEMPNNSNNSSIRVFLQSESQKLVLCRTTDLSNNKFVSPEM